CSRLFSFFCYCSGVHRARHSFPTRRSSDLSASALLTPSLIVDGAPSTASLASLRPRPVIARTALITATLLAPKLVSTTSNSVFRSEEHTSELQSRENLVCRLLLEKKNSTLT